MSIPDSSKNFAANSVKWNKKFIATLLLGGLLVVVASLRFLPRPGIDQSKLQEQLAEERQKAEQEMTRRAEDERQKAEQEMKRRAEEERQQRLKAAKDKVSSMTNDAHARMKQIIVTARKKATSILSGYASQIPELGSKVNDKLQGYGNALGLVKRMAEDKLRGTHKTQEYLTEAFQPVVKAQAMTEAELRDALGDCTYKLNIEMAQLQAAAGQVLDVEGFKAEELGIDGALNQLLTTTTTQASKGAITATSATLEVAIEAVLIKTTFEALSKVLAKIVAKEAGSLGIGAGGAAIPGVDVATTAIAVGGTIWTAYDVYRAVDELKKVEPTIRAGLKESMQTLEEKTDQAFTSVDESVAVLLNKK